MSLQTPTTERDIVPAYLAVKAMRDNGYKNAAYALAELVDNAVEAGATEIEVLLGDKVNRQGQRHRSQINRIGVLDNGTGMSPEILHLALQFGNGTHLEPENQTGIGRFGMGLPSSSISQCRRVDVWSWQNGIQNAFHTYLDLDEIQKKVMTRIPFPQQRPIPQLWMNVGANFGPTGTLVVWTGIDRSIWKTSNAIVRNSEHLIGRIYRRFIANHQVTIRFVEFDVDYPERNELDNVHVARANDPLYLMKNTSCPAPYDREPMFAPWQSEEDYESVKFIRFRGEEHSVFIRYAMARPEAREVVQPGARPYGKHAAKNIGVSIVRAGRELELDAGWSNSDLRERWWGVEIEFPPALDDLFGVTNNKQSARNFSDLATFDLAQYLQDEDLTLQAWKAQLEEVEDPQLPLLEIANEIKSRLNTIRAQLRTQTEGKRQRHDADDSSSPQNIATHATNIRRQEGHISESDIQEAEMEPEERKSEIRQTLQEVGIPEKQAEELAAVTVDSGVKYIFEKTTLASPTFFDVQTKGGSVAVLLNVNHPAYDHLMEVLEDEFETDNIEDLQIRLSKANKGLRLLLLAWARYEDELPDGLPRERAQDARVDWGKVARDFLRQE